MVVTVRLSSELEDILNDISEKLQKNKSDVIRDAISFYAKSLQDSKKSRLHLAIEKSKDADYEEYKSMESNLDDGLYRC